MRSLRNSGRALVSRNGFEPYRTRPGVWASMVAAPLTTGWLVDMEGTL